MADNRFTGNQYKQAWTPNSYIDAAAHFVQNMVSRAPQASSQFGTSPRAAGMRGAVNQPRTPAMPRVSPATQSKVQQLNQDVSSLPFAGRMERK